MTAVAAHELGRTYDCRIANCDQQATHNRGPYAYLCDFHKRQRQAEPRRPAEKPAPATSGPGFEEKAKGLVALGRDVDRAYRRAELAKAKCEKPIGAARQAKADADQLAEEFRRTLRELAV